jgi:hypothetical protein
MDELYSKVGIAVMALVAGNLVTRWWDRARPLVVLTDFWIAMKLSDKVVCTREIHAATTESMAVKPVYEGEPEYRDLESAYRMAVRELKLHEEIDSRILTAKKALTAASDNDGMIEGVSLMLRWTGMRELIEILYLRNLIRTKPPSAYTTSPCVAVLPSNENSGCYTVILGERFVNIGGNFEENKWAQQSITPLVEAIKHLDQQYLISVLDELPTHAAQQRETHRRIKDLIQPIRDDNTIWIAKCTVVNYGSSPLVLWPKAQLDVRENGKRDRIPVPCHVAKGTDDKEDAEDLKGPLVIESGKATNLWVVTSEKKAKLQNGNVINGLFKDRTATGQVSILLTQRGIAFKYRCKSTPLQFADE